jgi:hypothetical protein
VLFGLFLTLVFSTTIGNLALSLFIGVLGALVVGWFTTATTTGPKTQPVGTSEGIDAGLKYWLFFLLGFVWLGYSPPMSIFLGAMAGLGAGWMIAWWKTKEESRTQLPDEISQDDEAETSNEPSNIRRRRRRATRRYRRTSRIPDLTRFWRR